MKQYTYQEFQKKLKKYMILSLIIAIFLWIIQFSVYLGGCQYGFDETFKVTSISPADAKLVPECTGYAVNGERLENYKITFNEGYDIGSKPKLFNSKEGVITGELPNGDSLTAEFKVSVSIRELIFSFLSFLSFFLFFAFLGTKLVIRTQKHKFPSSPPPPKK